MTQGFEWWGQTFEVFDHPYNTTALNERGVELPIAFDWLKGRGGRGLEVGNVLGHYGVTGHHVVDKYEMGLGVDNRDVEAIDGRYRWIVSISTLEHVGFNEPNRRDLNASERAVKHLRSLLVPSGGAMLVTVPLGWHLDLDEWLLEGEAGAWRECTMVLGDDGWRQTERLAWRPYGARTKWAESVYIGEWRT